MHRTPGRPDQAMNKAILQAARERRRSSALSHMFAPSVQGFNCIRPQCKHHPRKGVAADAKKEEKAAAKKAADKAATAPDTDGDAWDEEWGQETYWGNEDGWEDEEDQLEAPQKRARAS